MKRIIFLLITGLLFSITPALAGSVGLMSIEELKPLIGSDDVIILDVRTGRDWSTSEFKIPGAIRAAYGDFDTWSDTYPKDKKIVLYCA